MNSIKIQTSINKHWLTSVHFSLGVKLTLAVELSPALHNFMMVWHMYKHSQIPGD
jgi:hypothetical protein